MDKGFDEVNEKIADWEEGAHYGIIAEFKMEGPLIIESKPMTRGDAVKRMRQLCDQPHVIRAAVVLLVYESGNDTLAPAR